MALNIPESRQFQEWRRIIQENGHDFVGVQSPLYPGLEARIMFTRRDSTELLSIPISQFNKWKKTNEIISSKRDSAIRQAKTKRKIVDLLGGVCARCGFTDIRALQIDHIDGNGKADSRGARAGGLGYYTKVLKFLLEHPAQTFYQTLCANCNWIKRAEKNENPKRR